MKRRAATARRRVGTLLLDKPPLAWPLAIPDAARKHWASFRNRAEFLMKGPDGRGFQCEWEWTSRLNVVSCFQSAGRRLLQAALSEWPIVLRRGVSAVGADAPDVSFIVGHRGEERLPLLIATLESLASQRDCTVEVIVVEQSTHPVAKSRLPKGVLWMQQIPRGPDEPYSRSWAFNGGARIARGRILILHDNDMLSPADYAAEIVRLIGRGYEAASLMRFLFYLSESDTDAYLRTEDRVKLLGRCSPESVQQNSQGGTIAITRDAYFRIGGHDESFVGWGGEDNEFFDRCRTLRLYSWGFLPFVHLWHTPQPSKFQATGVRSRLEEALEVGREERVRRLSKRQFDHGARDVDASRSRSEGSGSVAVSTGPNAGPVQRRSEVTLERRETRPPEGQCPQNGSGRVGEKRTNEF